ncbi:MAG: DUF4831 family protein [Bacteroidales bacterium]|nr:DUF4831 family protein [Bacteroidales bacterium]
MKKILYLLPLVILASCSSTEKKFIKVENIQTVHEYKNNPIIYSLPKTVVSVEVTAVNEISVKGPYSMYAHKYLGTDDVITENSSVWYISNTEISSYPVKDSSRTFVVESNYPCSYNFSPEGFLESVNAKSDYNSNNTYYQEKQNLNIKEDNINKNQFNTLNINRYETVFDTVLHVVDADSIFTAVPTANKQIIRKSIDEQAQELANQIFILRDDRNALLVGEADNKNQPSGDALKYMIEQLNKLEESYMSMFIGKKIKIEKKYEFSFTPENTKHIQTTLFKFSPEYGVQPKTSLRGNPINIDITNLLNNSVEQIFEENQANIIRKNKIKPSFNGIAYLTPANGLIRIIQNNSAISEKIININQMGIIRYLPSTLMEDTNFKAIFYPEYGTLKSLN